MSSKCKILVTVKGAIARSVNFAKKNLLNYVPVYNQFRKLRNQNQELTQRLRNKNKKLDFYKSMHYYRKLQMQSST